jgi:hypothetical protein
MKNTIEPRKEDGVILPQRAGYDESCEPKERIERRSLHLAAIEAQMYSRP